MNLRSIPARVAHKVVERIRARPVESSFVILAVTAFAVLAVLTWAIHQNRTLSAENKVLSAQGAEAHHALCVFKEDLSRRIDESQSFLAEPPKTVIGIPVTPAVIAQVESQLKGQLSTYNSLSSLACGPLAPRRR